MRDVSHGPVLYVTLMNYLTQNSVGPGLDRTTSKGTDRGSRPSFFLGIHRKPNTGTADGPYISKWLLYPSSSPGGWVLYLRDLNC